MAQSVVDFFKNEKNIALIDELKSLGINERYNSQVNDLRFEGKTFVLTGKLEKFSRDEASQIIESFGGKTSSSVSKKTDFVLLGENAGSKEEKARALNIKIISENDFENLIK